MTIKLLAVTLPIQKPAGLWASREIDLERPVDHVLGWRVLLRGPAVVLLSPAGRAYEFARSACVLTWGDSKDPADYDKLQTYTSPPLARRTPEQIEEEALERATDPGKAGAR